VTACLSFLLLVGVAACKGDSTGPESGVATVTVTPADQVVEVGDVEILVAEAFDADGVELTEEIATWTSRDQTVATVSNVGVVSGEAEGTTFVVATVGGVSDSAAVTVLTPVTLTFVLTDGTGYLWDISPDGSISNGTIDAYDGGMDLLVDGAPFPNQATGGQVGTEVYVGPVSMSGLQVLRRIYVPDNEGYARYLDVFSNPGDTAVTFNARIATNLGSDGGTVIVNTSDFDVTFEATDFWIVTDDTDGAGDPSLTHVFAHEDADVAVSAVSAPTGLLNYEWDLTVSAGERVILLHFASQNPNRSVASFKAGALYALSLGALDGLTDAELESIVNFDVSDD
jgi:hypothetical protein